MYDIDGIDGPWEAAMESAINADADARGLGASDGSACCEGCGADWAADEACAKACPGGREHCGDCGGLWPEVIGDRWLCGACKPSTTAESRMRAGDAQ